jgi:hypothetical protein
MLESELNVRGTLFNVLPWGFTSRLDSGLSESSIFLTPPPLGSMIAVDTVSRGCKLCRKAEESGRYRGKRHGCHWWMAVVVAGINRQRFFKNQIHCVYHLRYKVRSLSCNQTCHRMLSCPVYYLSYQSPAVFAAAI